MDMNDESKSYELDHDAVEEIEKADIPETVADDTFEISPEEASNEDHGIASIFIHEEDKEPMNVPVRKERKIRFSSVIMFVLAVTMIGGGAYTVGYYNGQIHLNEAAINDKIVNMLDSNYRAEIYRSVVDYLDENGVKSLEAGNNISEIYKNVGASVVGITSKSYVFDWFNNQRESQASGSGVIIDQNATHFYIVTNYHVVTDASDVMVEVANNQIINSKLIGYDEDTDLAVLSIEKKDIPSDILKTITPIPIGDSSKLEIGEIAIAIGNPLGYNNSVTLGIVSAVERQVKSDATMRYIQTDAAINPGNSGGALVNSRGELIGINTAKIAIVDVEGMGFAIPSDTMKDVVSELIRQGYVSKPYIGIGGADIDESTANLYNIPVGVLVRHVYDGSPAKAAGIKEMDLIVGVNDVKVFGMTDLTDALKQYKPGETINIKLVRNEKETLVIPVVLGDRNAPTQNK